MICRFRPLLALLAVVTALVMLAAHADARPSSGGSRGSRTFSAPATTNTAPRSAAPIERTMTQPGKPSVAGQAAPAGSGFFNRPGLLGGLAAGFIGAGLFGMLFGHGMFSNMGGLASILGLILQVGLIVIVARLAWAWWQRRNQPAFAGAVPRQMNEYGDPRSGLGSAAMGSASAPVSDNIEIAKPDYDAFENLLGEIQTAYSAEDLAALRSRVTPEMLSYFSEDLAQNASRGVVNKISDVKLLQGDMSEAWSEGATEYATVAMRFSLVDQTVERASGRVVEGDASPVEVTELWTFMRTHGGKWLLSAIQEA
ncbi:MAG: Tim44 domain-containing protein [Hyphomicrobiales bacterium]